MQLRDLVHARAGDMGAISCFSIIAHGRSDSQLPIETSAHPHARRLLEGGHDLTLQPFDGDHVIVPWVVGRAVEFFLGPAPAA